MARTQELFSIGDVAQLFHLSVSSLRHYETIGLLTPEYTDPATGYRYYGPRQFEVLNTIRYLRALDMPLGQIRAFLRNRDGGLLARDHDDRLRPDERPGKIRDRDPHPRHGGMKKRCPENGTAFLRFGASEAAAAAVAAATEGLSLTPLMVTVRVLDPVPPWASVTV